MKRNKKWAVLRWGAFLHLLLLLLPPAAPAAEYQPLPPPPRAGLSADWLIFDAPRNQLLLYLPDYHPPATAYYQWVNIKPGQPIPVTFIARKDLSIFLDNQLVFTAQTPATYSLNLGQLLPPDASAGPHLLCLWHPAVPPDVLSFRNAPAAPPAAKDAATEQVFQAQLRVKGHQGQNVFLCFLLLIGLLYGGIRAAYQPGFACIYQFERLLGKTNSDEAFLTKPTITWLNLLLVFVFALSFALLLVAIHTNIQSIVILRRLFDVPESAIVIRVLLYAFLIAVFILGKYPFLELMGYIFDVGPLVTIQYREFVRTIPFMGLFLPVVMLFYLGLNQTLPEMVLWISNGVVSLMLIVTVLRIVRTLQRRVSLLNLHLFSYLCATEVIPLIILLKLVVFTY